MRAEDEHKTTSRCDTIRSGDRQVCRGLLLRMKERCLYVRTE